MYDDELQPRPVGVTHVADKPLTEAEQVALEVENAAKSIGVEDDDSMIVQHEDDSGGEEVKNEYEVPPPDEGEDAVHLEDEVEASDDVDNYEDEDSEEEMHEDEFPGQRFAVGVAGRQGMRESNEDAFAVERAYMGTPHRDYFAVFDGTLCPTGSTG